MRSSVAETVARLPRKPGVYIMRGARGACLYIGKATDLRSRVRSYFTGQDPRPFVRFLDELLEDVEFVLTANPKEALLLENTLIKRHKPRFNFMLRDDKNYLAIRIDERVDWPRVELVRRIRRDGARYFGPYHSAAKVRETLNVLNRYFQLRTCTDSVLRNRSRPCLQYQIRRCPAPCVRSVDRDAYMDNLGHARLFLDGRETELAGALTARMTAAAERLEFEDAARCRDQISAVRDSLTRQSAVQTTHVDQDVIGLYREGDAAAVVVMVFRGGSLVDVRSFALEQQLVEDADLLSDFLGQYYGAADRDPPGLVLLPAALAEDDDVETALSDLRQARCRLVTPQRGRKRELVDLAGRNAGAFFAETLSTTARADRAIERLQRRLGLTVEPRTIECYDVSNFQGAEIVASRVVFQDAVPDRSRYRRIRIRTRDSQDDFGAMAEVIGRRCRSSRGGDDPMPDLIVVDGGKGQLNAAVAALAAAGESDQAIVSLAKSRVVGTTRDDAVVRSDERVFVPGRKNPVTLADRSIEGYLLQRVRDEAHRHAISYHRKLRRRNTLRSQLDAIAGIGPGRRNTLLRHFGSAKAVASASLVELESVPGLSRHLAFAVFEHFHSGEADGPR